MTQPEAESLLATALPCPFCGERLVVRGVTIFFLMHPVNDECTMTYKSFRTVESIELWNRRANPYQE